MSWFTALVGGQEQPSPIPASPQAVIRYQQEQQQRELRRQQLFQQQQERRQQQQHERQPSLPETFPSPHRTGGTPQRPSIKIDHPKSQPEKPTEDIPLVTPHTLKSSPSEFLKSAEERDAILHPATSESVQIANLISTLRSQYAMQAAIDKNKTQIMNLTAVPFAKKIQHQTAQLNGSLNAQIEGQKAVLHQLQLKLTETLKAQLKQKIEEEMLDTIRGTVQQKIHQAVEEELKRNAVVGLKTESPSRSQTYYQHEVDIHNLIARRHNSNLSVNSKESLQMLWRPVHLGNGGQVTPPSPSKLFPKNLGELYKLSMEDLKMLLQEYGGEELVSIANQSPEETLSVREKYLNRFMHLIGIPSNIVRVSTSGSKDKPTYYVFTDNSAPLPPILSFA